MRPRESVHSRALQWLYKQPANSQLNPTNRLSEIFPNGPRSIKESTLDIIVSDVEGIFYAIL